MNKIFKFDREILDGKEIFVRKNVHITEYPISHWHNFYEFIFYKNCKGSCVINGRSYEIGDNCLFLVTPKDFHKISTENIEGSYSINVSFTSSVLDKRLLAELEFTPRAVYNINPLFEKIIENIFLAFNSPDSVLKNIKLKGLLNSAIVDILTLGKKAKKDTNHISPHVQKAITYIVENPSEEITLHSMAKSLNIVPDYFSKLFHDSVGTTFKDYLNIVRIDYAKRLLEESELSVTDVGLESGYNSTAHFFRVFKKYTLTTPYKYREEKRKNPQ